MLTESVEVLSVESDRGLVNSGTYFFSTPFSVTLKLNSTFWPDTGDGAQIVPVRCPG